MTVRELQIIDRQRHDAARSVNAMSGLVSKSLMEQLGRSVVGPGLARQLGVAQQARVGAMSGLVSESLMEQLGRSVVGPGLARQLGVAQQARVGAMSGLVSESLMEQLGRSVVGPGLARQLGSPRSLADDGLFPAEVGDVLSTDADAAELRLFDWFWALSPRDRRRVAIDLLFVVVAVGAVFQAAKLNVLAQLIATTAFVLQLCRVAILLDELLGSDD
jgi:hypothetical protein